jgi:uncharacterized protein YceK
MLRVLLAVAVVMSGCATVMKAAGFPPAARRKTPPLALDAQALAVGATVPRLAVRFTAGAPLELPGGPVVLLFYRGHW